CAIYADYW
nr:immunoglobulin heavy chain junction region [Mus musculus]